MWFSCLKDKWLKDRHAAVAVEFSFVFIPFLIMFVGVIEVGLFFGTAVVLEGASTDAARLIRTGQIQDAADPVAAFEQQLCDTTSLLISCADIQYEVIDVPDNSFISAETNAPTFDEDGNLVSSGFDPGGAEDVIIIRVVYRYEFLTPLLGELMESSAGTNSSVLMSSVVLMNEPYEFGGSV